MPSIRGAPTAGSCRAGLLRQLPRGDVPAEEAADGRVGEHGVQARVLLRVVPEQRTCARQEETGGGVHVLTVLWRNNLPASTRRTRFNTVEYTIIHNSSEDTKNSAPPR